MAQWNRYRYIHFSSKGSGSLRGKHGLHMPPQLVNNGTKSQSQNCLTPGSRAFVPYNTARLIHRNTKTTQICKTVVKNVLKKNVTNESQRCKISWTHTNQRWGSVWFHLSSLRVFPTFYADAHYSYKIPDSGGSMLFSVDRNNHAG